MAQTVTFVCRNGRNEAAAALPEPGAQSHFWPYFKKQCSDELESQDIQGCILHWYEGIQGPQGCILQGLQGLQLRDAHQRKRAGRKL